MIESNKSFLSLLSFRSRPDCWYVANTWVTLEGSIMREKGDNCLHECTGYFNGWTMETIKGYSGILPATDGEICPLDEFDIFMELKPITPNGESKYVDVSEMSFEDIIEIGRNHYGDDFPASIF